MGEKPAYRRKQYLVDRPYQLRFVVRLLMMVFAIAMCGLLTATALLWVNMYQPELGQQSHVIAALLGAALTIFMELLIAIPLVWYVGIRQTHRVVGPMSRILRTLQAIGQGDFSPRLTLRRGDVLQDLAKAINEMAERLQQRYLKSPQ